MWPSISLIKYRGETVIQIRHGSRCKRYELTKEGCLQVGRDIYTKYKGEVRNWTYSSSVDFPKDFKKHFKWDVRELVSQGFQEIEDKDEAPYKSLMLKIMEFTKKREFQSTLDKDEKKAYNKLTEHINKSCK